MRFSLLALIVVLAAGPAFGQARTKGFFISPRLYAASLAVEDGDEAGSGGGLGLRLGYGVSKTVTVYAALEGAGMDASGGDLERLGEENGLGSFDLGAQFNFLPSNTVNPFLRVGLNGTAAVFDQPMLDSDDDPRFGGGGLTLGAGAEFHVSRALAIEAALDVTGGEINSFEVVRIQFNDLDGSPYGTARLGVGLVWRP